MKMGGPRGELDGDRPLLVKGFLSLISESFEIFEAVITLLEIRAGELVWTNVESWELTLKTHCYTS